MSFHEHIDRALLQLEQDGILRQPHWSAGPQAPELHLQGRNVLGFCSNDYLGLASDPRLVAATRRALDHTGVGSGASRHISGTHAVHREAESALAAHVRLPAALLFSTGYAANVGAIPALMGPSDVIFSDALNHASLIDGCRLSRARTLVDRHSDPEHLAQLLRAHRPRYQNALVVTESLFSMAGDEAPLAELRDLADRHASGLMVDEAHALGIFGPDGGGLAQEVGITPDLLVGTLGKAFGCAGAFVAASAATVRLIENRARSYLFSTAPPPLLAAAALAATELVQQADSARAHVLAHAKRIRDGLRELGYRPLDGRAPIVPVLVGPARRTMALSAALLERGVFVHGIRPPTVPDGTSRLRITPIASHTQHHLDTLLAAMAACKDVS